MYEIYLLFKRAKNAMRSSHVCIAFFAKMKCNLAKNVMLFLTY